MKRGYKPLKSSKKSFSKLKFITEPKRKTLVAGNYDVLVAGIQAVLKKKGIEV